MGFEYGKSLLLRLILLVLDVGHVTVMSEAYTHR